MSNAGFYPEWYTDYLKLSGGKNLDLKLRAQ